MTAGELKATLDNVCTAAEARKHKEYASDDFDENDRAWKRVVKLMNLCTACKEVQRLLKVCELEDTEF